MSEFYGIAESILGRLADAREKIHIDEIRDSVAHGMGEDINFYPGVPGAHCHKLAVFVSLGSPLYVKGRKHFKCGEAMEKIVQHMQGNCVGRTTNVVFITDSWDEIAFSKWKANLEQISRNNHFEIYLLVGRSISVIKI